MIKKTALIGIIILFTLLLIYCTTDESTIIGPFGNAGKYISVANFSADKTMLYSNGDTTVVRIRVLDVDKTPAIGLKVDFAATIGSITESDTTDSSGIALATFISDDNTGENIITVDTGVKKHTLTLRVVHYQPDWVEMFSEDPVLLADGIDKTTITTVLKDSVGNPMPGITVKFATTLGTLSSHIEITDENGVATTDLTSTNSDGTALVTATSFVTNSIEVEFKLYVPIDIDITSETLTLLADGISSTEITATPRDDQGRKMPNIPVYFSTTLGTLSSKIVNTEADGVATTTLTSTTEEGVATVSVTSVERRSVDIKFQKYVASFIDISAASPVVLAGGEKGTTITAVLKDSTGKRMEGETVRFSTTLGTLSSSIELTDQEGTAQVELTSSTAPGTALVIATSFVSDSVEVDFSINVPNAIDMSASPSIILADGISISTITAIPKDANGNTMPGISVQFSTTLGTLSETIKITDQDGIATTVLTSGTTEGIAWVTATSSISSQFGVQLIAYNPANIELKTDIDGNSILADGISEINVIAEVYNSANVIIPWALVDFSTTDGSLNKITVRANQDGKAIVVLRSAGSDTGIDAVVTAEVQGTSSISETISVRFRGVSMTTIVDSLQFTTGGYYNAFIRTELIDVDEGIFIENATVAFGTTIGEMRPEVDITDEFGRTFSILYAEATGSDQNGLVITPELFYASEVNDPTPSMEIPGVEALISTVDDEVMGDGEGWALVKATLRETTTNKSITEVGIDWATTLGTIKGLSETNTTGHTVDTLRIENSVSTNTNVTITANFGDNISISDIVTFIPPINSNRLILGFEPDTTGHGIIPCNIDTSLAVREAGISALFVNSASNPISGQLINFSVVPNNFALICPIDTTKTDTTGTGIIGLANVMIVYPPQRAGEIVRVWAEAPDGTRGSIDVILPKDPEEDDSGGG